MPYTRDQWKAAIGTDINKLSRASDLIDAAEIAKVSPVGLSQQEQTYQLPMSAAQKQAIRDDFMAIIQAVIADLQAGLA